MIGFSIIRPGLGSQSQDTRMVKIPKSRINPKVLAVEYLTTRILDKMAQTRKQIWVKLPVQWTTTPSNSGGGFFEIFDSTQIIAWYVITIVHCLDLIYILLFLTGNAGIALKDVQTWFILYQLVIFTMGLATIIAAHLFHKSRKDVAGYANAIGKLYKECIPSHIVSQNRLLVRLIDLIASSMVTSIKYAIILMGLSSLVMNLDPGYLHIQHYSHYRIPWLLYRYLWSPLILMTISYNCAFTVITLANILVISVIRLTLILMAIMQLPVAKASVLFPLQSQFNIGLSIYNQMSLLVIILNDTGRVEHPLILFTTFFVCAISGSVLILASSKMVLSPSLITACAVLFSMVAIIIFGGMTAATLCYDLSNAFKVFWTTVGVCWRRVKRKRLGATRSIRVKMGWMGFVDKSFLLTFLNSMLSCVVNVVMFAG